MKRYEHGLRELILGGEDRITILRLCEVSGRKTSNFKYQYMTLPNFIAELCEYNLATTFRKQREKSFSKTLYAILEKMYDDKIYYHGLYKLLSAGHKDRIIRNKITIYHGLEKIFLEELEKYIKPDGVLRMRDIQGCASHICSRLQVWLMHGLNEKPQTIFHELRVSLENIEKAKLGEA